MNDDAQHKQSNLSDSVLEFNSKLFDYLDNSPTTFHAVAEAVKRLQAAGFEPLEEKDVWQLEVGKKYYLQRNASSLIAFNYANTNWAEKAVRLLGAHCDSPCLKVKPEPLCHSQSYVKLGVEVYGGALLNPWFDRDLSLAGRVVVECQDGSQKAVSINFVKPIAFIPSLAIHLDREANKNRTVNPQKDILPIILQNLVEKGGASFEAILQEQILREHPNLVDDLVFIRDFELSFYDVQRASYVGLRDDFFASARLDNLLSCYVGISALIHANAGDSSQNTKLDNMQNSMLVINDHEEVGSQTAQGAQGAFLSTVLERICGGAEESSRCLARSMLISADNAHGVHPNYPDKHDANHGPLLNAGPVIKMNANQRYATNSLSSAKFKQLADSVKVNTQSFVVRSDMACGSTIGPITAAELGVQTIDVGVPTFAMHSIRESAGSMDAWALEKVVIAFFQETNLIPL